MFPTLARRLVTSSPVAPKLRSATRARPTAPPPLPGVYGQYKLKKVWPPDFSKLSEKEKFRFERRYKRRIKLRSVRPRWDKYMRLAQLGGVTFVIVYSVLFMDWNTDRQPFEGIRSRFWGVLGMAAPNRAHARQQPDLQATAEQK